MPNPILPLIPWTGGLNLRENPSLANAQQLVQADDIVYDFDGSRHKRGGQSHRNRIPMLGGQIDDHFTKAPPGDWTVTGDVGALSLEDDGTTWRYNSSQTVTLTRNYLEKFTSTMTMRLHWRPVTMGQLTLSVHRGAAAGGALFSIRLSADGVLVLTANSTYEEITAAGVATFDDLPAASLPNNGTELFDTDNVHVWRFDWTASSTIQIYFDETLLCTTKAITNTQSDGDGDVVLDFQGSGGTADIYVDAFEVRDTSQEHREALVTALYDFSSLALERKTTHRLIAVCNDRVYYDPGDHSFRVLLDNYQHGGSIKALFDFTSFNGKLFIARTGDVPLLRWDLTTLDEVPNAPHVSIIRTHRNRLVGAGDPSRPSRIYGSGLLNEEVWTTEDSGDFTDSFFIDVDPEDGGIVTGVGPSFFGDLVLYKTSGIYRLTGSDTTNFVMGEITKSLGAASHYAIVNVGDDQYFLSKFGVHSLITTQKYGDLNQAFLSNDLRRLWNESINPDILSKAWAVNNELYDRYELLLPLGIDEDASGMIPNRILCLHYGVRDEQLHPQGRWSIKVIEGGCLAAFVDENGEKRIFAGSVDGFVNRQDERYRHDFPVYKVYPGAQVEL